ncbi:unnamed protein product, partial [Discosporangium mesarthrocarpum]
GKEGDFARNCPFKKPYPSPGLRNQGKKWCRYYRTSTYSDQECRATRRTNGRGTARSNPGTEVRPTVAFTSIFPDNNNTAIIFINGLLLDSGCTAQMVDPNLPMSWKHHITSAIELSPPRTVHVTGGATLRATASGTLKCITTDNRGKDIDATVNSVLIVPGLGRHLFSLSAGCVRSATTILSSQPRQVVAKTIIPLRAESNLFFLDARVESTTTSSTSTIHKHTHPCGIGV